MGITLAQPSRQVFVITHTHHASLWGLHRESPVNPNLNRIQVVAFRARRDAENIADRLWKHRLKAKQWPKTTLGPEEGLWIASPDDVLYVSASPLKVDQVDQTWLLKRLSLSAVALSVVDPLPEGSEGEPLLSGSYLHHEADATAQIKWLDKMWRARPHRK